MFYANKIQKSLKEGETDTPGRIILTSSTVGLLHDRIKTSNYILSTDVIRTSLLKIGTVNNLKNRLESELVGCKLVSNLLRLLRKKFVRGIWLSWQHRCCQQIQIARLQFCNSSNVVEYMGVVVKTDVWIHPNLIITPFSQAALWWKTFLLMVSYLHLVSCVCSFQAELADIMGRYKKLSGNDLSKDAEGKFSGNMKKLILPKLKKGKYLFRLMAYSFFVAVQH